ncbi:MAG: radical SAM family heme chaperone HemW [Proteobacteria bacterium]|nr:radical SAM family heme chaperone HemW [Pseudomonadota bacterium]
MKQPPLSLYVHLPWCVRKCPYCDFNSHQAGDAPAKKRYLDALLVDLDLESARADGRVIETIFLGGGTPSLFSPAEIGRLLGGITTIFQVADDAEITMEANPGNVECGDAAGYRKAGVNRLSIGAQSFDDRQLQVLGRIHDSADIVRAVSDAHKGGFENINIDLMHGLPGQSVADALADLESAMRLAPAHISWYELTLEPNTVFYARPPANMPDDELAFEIQVRGRSLLGSRGYAQYEVSAFARNGSRCRHNLNYWLFGDYVAVGAGAHGKLTVAEGILRYHKPANPLQYMIDVETGADLGRAVALSASDLVFEFMLNALRLNDGFAESTFCDTTGLTAATLFAATSGARERGLIARADDAVWRPTDLGGRFLNDLQSEFLLDSA